MCETRWFVGRFAKFGFFEIFSCERHWTLRQLVDFIIYFISSYVSEWLCPASACVVLLVLGSTSRHFAVKRDVYKQSVTSPLMPSRCNPVLLSLAFCNLLLYFFIWSGGGCSQDKSSWRRLIFKRTSVICCRRQSALSFAPVKEGSQRFRGRHCLCSAMLNHFWLDTILKLGL